MKTKILFLTMFLFSIQVWAIEYDTTLVLNQDTIIRIDTLARTEWVSGSASTINNVKVKNGAILTVLLNDDDEVLFEGMRNMEWVGTTAVMKKAGICTFEFKRGGSHYGVHIDLNYFGELEYKQGEDTVSFPATLVPIITIKNSEIILSNYDTTNLSTTQTLGYGNNDLTSMRVGFFGFNSDVLGEGSSDCAIYWWFSLNNSNFSLNFAENSKTKVMTMQRLLDEAEKYGGPKEFYIAVLLRDGTANDGPDGMPVGAQDFYFQVKDERTSNIPVSSVSVSPATSTLNINQTQQLTANVLPENATNKSVTWSSSNTTVATVSDNGLVTAKAAGSATITVKTNDGGKTSTCEITVKVATVPVSSVNVSPTTSILNINQTQQLTANVLPANATDKSVTWESSNTSIATVSNNGLVTAKAAGSATITVKTNDGSKTSTCAISVNADIEPDVTTTSAIFSGKKTLNGENITLQDQQFEFELYNTTTLVTSAKNDATGNFTITIPDLSEGTYNYTLKEKNDNQVDYVYDTRTYAVSVNVKKESSTSLSSTVEIKNDDNMIVEKPEFINEYTSTGIEELLNAESSVRAFPNPINDFLQIKSLEVINKISLFDMSGKLIIEELVNNTDFGLEIKHLKAGMYLLKTQTENGTEYIKLIKE